MFGTNKITGRSYFSGKPGDPTAPKASGLKVTSVFYTLQGEGPYAGRPAVFVRLTHCNLACSFCDAVFEQGDFMSNEKLIALIDRRLNEEFNKVVDRRWVQQNVVLVITGGEPLLQQNLRGFIREVESKFAAVQIESNGTLESNLSLETVLVVSPKCAERDGKPTKYLQPGAAIARANYLKFVFSSDPDSPYNSIPDWAFEWGQDNGNQKIYISPMNIYNSIPQKIKLFRAGDQKDLDMEVRSTVDEVVSFWEPGLFNMKANQANHEAAARYCLKHGFTFNMQMHLFASLA